MGSRLNPYLSFPGNAREAMEFYQAALGGELTVSTFGEYGQTDTPIADQIMHAMLVTPADFTLMGSDTPPGMEHHPGDNVSVSLSGDDAAELRGYWDKLAEGATIAMPLERQMWGDDFGMLVDRFGINWLVNIAGTS
jgi:PhnB protein